VSEGRDLDLTTRASDVRKGLGSEVRPSRIPRSIGLGVLPRRRGSFGPIRVTIGASAVPGTAWISAEGRHSRLFAQAAFTVNTNWPQTGFSATHAGTNPFENVLSTADVARLGLDWSFGTGSDIFSSPAAVNGVHYDLQAARSTTGPGDSIEAHLTIVFAALAVSRWTETVTGCGLALEGLWALRGERDDRLVRGAGAGQVRQGRDRTSSAGSRCLAARSWPPS